MTTTTQTREAQPQQPETTDRDLSSLVSTVTGQNSNPYMKLAPTIIQYIVKYALPNASQNDSKTDLADLMGKVTSITNLLGSREVPTTTTQTREAPQYQTHEIVEEIECSEGEDGEEIVEEYYIEEGQDQATVKKTVYKNGVQISEETTAEKPNFHFRIPLENKGIRSSETSVDSTTDATPKTEVKEAMISGVVKDDLDYSETLPSIIEDESLPMNNKRSFETTSPTDTKKFGKRTLPKRSSSKRLSLELKAAVAAEIAKLEDEINEEIKHIPQPRKQSITHSHNPVGRKESKESIKAMAEGCLVRKPSNASSIKSNHSITEEWSGPVFEKKVFEVVVEHTPQLPDEVKLDIGDLVEVKQVFEDGWAYGINTATKTDGTFPVNCLGEEREPNKNGRYVPRLIRYYQARDEAGKKEIEDEEKFKHELTEYAKKKKEYKLKKQQRKQKKSSKK